MPELPDLDVVADALHAALTGRPLTAVRALAPLAVRGTPAELDALVGQGVARVARAGKFLDLDLERDRVVVNPMLTGRFQLAGRGEKAPSGTAVELVFGRRPAGSAPSDAREWTRGASWLPPEDGPVVLRYRDPTQMGKVYLLPAGVVRPVPGREPGEMGPDALDHALTLEAWRERIRKHPGELKNLLRNQAFVAGIGNAYSDEILHRARLSPMRMSDALTPDQSDALYAAIRAVLQEWRDTLIAETGDTFPAKVSAFRAGMAAHGRYGQPCPVCGTPIQRLRYAANEANYCPTCQTDGRLLADRGLSRLLKSDWPRSLEELERRKAAYRTPGAD